MTDNFDPRTALDAATDARRHFADRRLTPWWLYPMYGVFIALVCLGLGLPEEAINHRSRLYLFLAVVFGSVAITHACRRSTGVAIPSAVGTQTLRLMTGYAIGLAALATGSIANGLLDGPSWAPVLLGVLGLTSSAVFGKYYDQALRADLRESRSR